MLAPVGEAARACARLLGADFAAGHTCQLFPQTGNFIVELTDHCVLWVLIDPRLILNLLGAGRVPQSGNGFLRVVVGRADRRDHDCFSVAAEGVLKDPRESRVSVRNVGALGVSETANHMAQG